MFSKKNRIKKLNPLNKMETLKKEQCNIISLVYNTNRDLQLSKIVNVFLRESAADSIQSASEIGQWRICKPKIRIWSHSHQLTPKVKAEMKCRTAGKIAISYKKTFGFDQNVCRKFWSSSNPMIVMDYFIHYLLQVVSGQRNSDTF